MRMTTWAQGSAGVLALSMAAAVLPVPTAAGVTASARPAGGRAGAATLPVMTAVGVSPGSVAVRGLDLVPVTVTVTFSDTAWGDPDLVLLNRTTKGAWDRS